MYYKCFIKPVPFVYFIEWDTDQCVEDDNCLKDEEKHLKMMNGNVRMFFLKIKGIVLTNCEICFFLSIRVRWDRTPLSV